MNEHLVSKTINLCVVKLGNSQAKAGPMSKANAVGLACVPRLDLDCFESQADSPRLNQRPLELVDLARISVIGPGRSEASFIPRRRALYR